jgi:CRISPR/Cas system-associated exonuclease Cas4 (RecB family)/RNAse (barnase) inhibitor barstar
MMRTFLEELSESVYETYGEELSKLTLVFPNIRAGLFFRRHLSGLLSKPVWAPHILSIEEFVQQHSPLRMGDKLSMLVTLYEVYRRQMHQEESFDAFYPWGEMLLKDFDDLDKYLTDADVLFQVLFRQKEIDTAYDFLSEEQKQLITNFWKTFGDRHTKHQEAFLKIWRVLPEVYRQFTNQLRSQGLGYGGMIYRDTVNALDSGAHPGVEGPVLFVGFNALTLAEERIISWYLTHKNAQMKWDADAYYVDDKRQEAGYFLRRYRFTKGFARTFPTEFPNRITSDKKVEVIGVSLQMGQTRILGEKLAQWVEEEGFVPEKTVVVLPEEGLLFPVLHALPNAVQDVNITMGFPLRHTPLHNLLETLIHLQMHLYTDKEGHQRYHYREVTELLEHPYLRVFEPEFCRATIERIKTHNIVFLRGETLEGEHPIWRQVFKQAGEDLFLYVREFLLFLQSQWKDDATATRTEQESLYQYFTQLNRLEEVMAGKGIQTHSKTFLKLFRKVMRSVRLPFTGEPLKGLQVMGVLETRNLDFENVIILSMNEGSFPSAQVGNSFVPYNLRRAFDLPTYEQQDAIYAYMFYRLIQRAKRVVMLYNTEEGFMQKGEKSRFILQLEAESGLTIIEQVLANPVKVKEALPIAVAKSPAILEQLKAYHAETGQRSFTPSAINTYIDCPLKFYFRYLAGIKEPEEVQEEMSPQVFGNILHHSMEIMYRNLARQKGNNRVEEEDFPLLELEVKKAVDEAFQEHFKEPTGEWAGQVLIAWRVVQEYVWQILKWDRANAPFEMLGLELGKDKSEAIRKVIDVPVVGGSFPVLLTGIIDRVDRKEQVLRVIDYKTGTDNSHFDTVEALTDPENIKRNKAVMQTMCYALLVREKFKALDSQIQTGILTTKSIFEDKVDFRIRQKEEGKKSYAAVEDVSPMLDGFAAQLGQALSGLFDPVVPFRQTDNEDHCSKCPYTAICHR